MTRTGIPDDWVQLVPGHWVAPHVVEKLEQAFRDRFKRESSAPEWSSKIDDGLIGELSEAIQEAAQRRTSRLIEAMRRDICVGQPLDGERLRTVAGLPLPVADDPPAIAHQDFVDGLFEDGDDE